MDVILCVIFIPMALAVEVFERDVLSHKAISRWSHSRTKDSQSFWA